MWWTGSAHETPVRLCRTRNTNLPGRLRYSALEQDITNSTAVLNITGYEPITLAKQKTLHASRNLCDDIHIA